jgi:hypothetical protein
VPLEGLGQLKNPMTSSGFEPAAFWLVKNYVIIGLCLIKIILILCYIQNHACRRETKYIPSGDQRVHETQNF